MAQTKVVTETEVEVRKEAEKDNNLEVGVKRENEAKVEKIMYVQMEVEKGKEDRVESQKGDCVLEGTEEEAAVEKDV